MLVSLLAYMIAVKACTTPYAHAHTYTHTYANVKTCIYIIYKYIPTHIQFPKCVSTKHNVIYFLSSVSLEYINNTTCLCEVEC